MSAPSFTKEDFAKWNQTTSVFYLPKRLVGKSKVTSLRSELVKAIGESKVSVVQALPGLKFRVCFVSSSFRQYFDINGLNFRGLTITPFPAYEEVKSVFVDRAPPQMPDKYIYDALAPYGRVISVKHLTIKGFPSVQSGTRMVSMVIEKAIPAEIRAMGFQLSFRYRGQPPTCFACQEVGHTARDCPKSSKRGDKGRTKPSKPGKASAINSLNRPALSGSLNSSSPSSSHPRDLREKLARSKPAAVTPVGSGEDPVTLPASLPQSPLVEVVEVVPVATSSPRASLVEAGTSLQRESFDFSLEFSPDAPVVSESSSGWSKQFDRSVRRTGKDSLEIVVSSSAPRLGPKLINTPTTKSNGVPNNTSPTLKVKLVVHLIILVNRQNLLLSLHLSWLVGSVRNRFVFLLLPPRLVRMRITSLLGTGLRSCVNRHFLPLFLVACPHLVWHRCFLARLLVLPQQKSWRRMLMPV